MKPELIENKPIYKGKIFEVSLATVREENITYDREIVSHNGSVVIVPVFPDNTVALVRQYRHAAGKYLLEVPAGSLKKDETPEHGALRELEEEIGVTAKKIEKLTEFYVSPGFLTEKMYVFLVSEFTEVGQNLEEDELITIERYDFETLSQMILGGGFEDAKTIISLLLVGSRLGF